MARTRAVCYRDEHGTEPVDEFIESLPPRRAAKIDDYVEEYLNDRPASAPPPEQPKNRLVPEREIAPAPELAIA